MERSEKNNRTCLKRWANLKEARKIYQDLAK